MLFTNFLEKKQIRYEALKIETEYVKSELDFLVNKYTKDSDTLDLYNQDVVMYANVISALDTKLKIMVAQIRKFENSIIGKYLIPENEHFVLKENVW